MTNFALNRRRFLQGGTALSAAALLPSFPAFAEALRLRYYFFGGPARGERAVKVGQMYAAEAGIDFTGEFSGFTDFWPRLATQISGGNAPDVFQMDYGYLNEYGRRGTMRPLNDYVPSILNIENFGEHRLASGTVDGNLYAITVGDNSSAVSKNTAAWKEAGLDIPNEITWADFLKLCADFKAATPRKQYWATADASGFQPAFETFIRQQGQAMYTEAGEIAFDAAVTQQWFDYWAEMRASNGCVPADMQASGNASVEQSMLTQGYAATSFGHSTDLAAYRGVNPERIDAVPLPIGGPDSKPGQFIKPAHFMSVSATSKNPEAAAALINFYVTSLEAAKIMLLDRGVPPSPDVREAVKPFLDEAAMDTVAYLDLLEDRVGPLPPSPANGASEISQALTRISEEVGFGSHTPASGATQLIEEANQILARA